MTWLVPFALVLIVSLVFAVLHFVFVRWMARQSAPDERGDRPDGEERQDR